MQTVIKVLINVKQKYGKDKRYQTFGDAGYLRKAGCWCVDLKLETCLFWPLCLCIVDSPSYASFKNTWCDIHINTHTTEECLCKHGAQLLLYDVFKTHTRTTRILTPIQPQWQSTLQCAPPVGLWTRSSDPGWNSSLLTHTPTYTQAYSWKPFSVCA